jgi:hypothetical protein
MKQQAAAWGVIFLVFNIHYGSIPIASPTNLWRAIVYPGTTSDFATDEQAKSIDRDLVGDADHAAFYTIFDDNGTGADPVDGEIAFRLRMAGDQPPPGFGGQMWIGADVDNNGSLDIFIGANNAEVSIHAAGTDLNISPNTTSIEATPFWSAPAVPGDNYLWTEVTPVLDPDATNFDIDATKNGTTDYFLTFKLSFNAFVVAVNALTPVTDFDDTSPLAYVAATASQGQTLNADLNGVDGGVNSPLTWTDLDALSPQITVDGDIFNAPEPAATGLAIACAGLLAVLYTRRRRASRI